MTYGVMGLGSADLMAQAFRVGRNMAQQGSAATAVPAMPQAVAQRAPSGAAVPMIVVREQTPSRSAWLAAARRVRAALERSPNREINFYQGCRRLPDGALACGVARMTLQQVFARAGAAYMIDEASIAKASSSEMQHPDVREMFTFLMSVDQQLSSSQATPAPPQQTVSQVGRAAAQDPILGAASLLASQILAMYAGLPPAKRIASIRKKLNEMHPGLGNKAISKTRELQRKGRGLNQAIFDGVRLAIANRLAEHTAARLAKGGQSRGLGGLGKVSNENLQTGFCAILGAGTAGGGMFSAFKNPTATEGVLASGAAGAQIAGCTPGAMNQQAAMTQQQLDAAAAASSSAGEESGMPWLWIGLGLVAVAGIGLVVVKSR